MIFSLCSEDAFPTPVLPDIVFSREFENGFKVPFGSRFIGLISISKEWGQKIALDSGYIKRGQHLWPVSPPKLGKETERERMLAI